MATPRPAIDGGLLRLVRGRAGGTDESIRSAFESNETFRSLCADLRTCARALARWQRSDSAEAPGRVEEYAGLLEDLAEEIRQLLSTPGRAVPGKLT